MTNEEYKKITELEYKAKQCRAAGIDPEIDDGTAWAMTHTRECRMVTDGQRFWEQPRLILEFDVFLGGVVTMRCYLRNIPKLPRAVIEKTHASVAGDDLYQHRPRPRQRKALQNRQEIEGRCAPVQDDHGAGLHRAPAPA